MIINEIKFITIVLMCTVAGLSVLSCTTFRKSYGFKVSDFRSKEARAEILDIIDYIELEEYLKTL
jgi:Tfp pilus assembly protein PilE